MSNSYIGHQFTINQVTFSGLSDSYVNIQKRKELVQYRSVSNGTNVNLSFVQSEDINSDINLTINDRSTSLMENKNLVKLEDQILENVIGFNIEIDSFLLTDIFTTNLTTQTRIPLFYQHTLNRTLDSGEFYVDIKILDQDFKSILPSRYVVDNDGLVYSNLQNIFNPTTGLSEIFFVTYSVKKSNGVLERYTEILNNEPVYKQAEIDDIDPDFGNIIPGHKVYLVQEDIGNTFNITLPTSTDYGLRRSLTNRIEIIPPVSTGTDDPWFVRIRSGKFLSSGVTGINKYYIAEFASQNYIPFFPYKQTDETSYRVSSRIVKTLRNKIAISSDEEFYPEVVVYDKDGIFRFALTANPDRLGVQAFDQDTYFSNVLLGNTKVTGTGINATTDPISGSSIDSFGGFIVLPAGYEISETDTIRSIYTYEEEEFEFTLFDFNPLNSADLLSKRIALILRPEPLGSTLTKSLFYLVINEDGLITDTNLDFSLNGLSTTASDAILVSGLWYDRDPDTVTWAPSGGKDFVDYCTVEGINNQDDILILGDVYTRDALHPVDLVINDIRVRGGGILEDEEAQAFWDAGLWDGKPFPGAAAIFIDVPIEILTTVSGDFTPENIQEIVLRHIAHGVYPIVHGYSNYQSTVSGLDFVSSGFYTLQWNPGPPDSVYDIYEEIDSELTLLVSGLTDPEYTASGINEKKLLVASRYDGSDAAYIGGSIADIQILEV